jgi:hypothetical protein
MTIYRDGKAIELTGLELHQAYEEVRDQYFMDEIGNTLREDYDVEPCTDDSEIDLREIAQDMQNLLANNDTHWECEVEAKHQAIEQYLKEKGI